MFRLLVISAPTALPDEPRHLAAVLAAGAPALHLRKPGWPAAQVEALLRALPAALHPRLVLHGHPALVRRYGLGGLHLPAGQRAATRPALLPGQTLSTSFHALAEIARHRRRYDYVFLSPVFDSFSKPGYAGAFALPEVAAFFRRLPARPPVLALGGITAHNLALVRQTGFAGAALLGAIWQSPDPGAAFRQVRAAGA